jgi:hypothetical protein
MRCAFGGWSASRSSEFQCHHHATKSFFHGVKRTELPLGFMIFESSPYPAEQNPSVPGVWEFNF